MAGVILAAGLGRRMGGQSKMLLPWRGRPLVEHIAVVARASRLADIVVVTGHNAAEVTAALHQLPARMVYNPEYATGLSASLRAGITALPPHASAALIILGDQPLLTTDVVNRLLDAYWRTNALIVAPVAGGRRGNPVLFARELFPELLQTTGDQGAQAVIAGHKDQVCLVEVEAALLEDMDTPEAYAMLVVSGEGR